MTTATDRIPEGGKAPIAGEPDPRRWLTLVVVAIAQLMVVLDATIVNIAAPRAQEALHMSTADRQWIVTAYTLTFGGFLLLGGRIADFVGRKRTFVAGLIAFAAASALGGIAPNAGLLWAARALQGACAAVLAPAALALITVTFTESRERARAFAVWGAIAAGGSAVGLILGGVLTEYASWRWCLLVNVPIAIGTALVAGPVLRESRAEGPRRYDVAGGVAVTAGLVSLVYGFTRAGEHGWSSGSTLAFLGIGVLLIASFVGVEARSVAPLLPARVPGDRDRGGSYLTSILLGAGLLSMFLFMTYYLQLSLAYSPLRTGFAYLPFSLGVIVTAGLASQIVPRFGPKIPMLVGSLLCAGGLLGFTQVGVHTSYVSHVLGPMLLLALGMGLLFVPLSATALAGVDERDAGVASALVNSTQQVGGALGVALLNTVFTTAKAGYLTAHRPVTGAVAAKADIHGYATAFFGDTLVLVGAFFVVLIFIRPGRHEPVPEIPSQGG